MAKRGVSHSSGSHKVFILDSSSSSLARHRSHRRAGKCNAILEDQGSSASFGTGIWNSFSEFFRIVIQQEESPLLGESSSTSGIHLHKSLSELPLIHVCPTSIPAAHDLDSADEVLSQLLYAGFGRIGSTLDGLLAVIFPSLGDPSGDMADVKMDPVAELCAPSSRCVTAEDFSGSLDQFYAWLKERLPQGGALLDLWGTAPGTKRVANLWRELLEGEISLEDSRPPKRTVHVASVQIVNESGEMLVEAYQEMADGRIRPRNRPLSEKMRPGESVEEACLRGISEELGCAIDQVALLRESYQRVEEERESFSYPGLSTRYVIHTITAHVKQLPQTDFDTEEDEDGNGGGGGGGGAAVLVAASGRTATATSCLGGAVGVRKHFWKWVQQAP
ncbi:uncharacterized protein LOC9652423 [Selaginella moellendorffii]|nr:uncharacterized protein LOC9652423 [Selaginella moellendorffii]|eukprot:XP_002993079.2 uncharacterized protein LOC9652423 [Selaginella moellendorffii]